MISLAILTAVLTGFALARALWPSTGPLWRWQAREDWVRLGLGIPLGLGLSSIQPHLSQGSPIATDLGMLVAALSAAAVLGLKSSDLPAPYHEEPAWRPALWLALAAAAATAFALFYRYRPDPHGDIEAWRVWNMRARFVFRGGSLAALTESALSWTHPEFPHLLTASVLRTWRWAGAETQDGPIAVAFAFAASLPMLVYGTLRLLRTHTQALLGLAAVLGSTVLMGNATAQTADLPLAVFVAGSLAAILLAEHTKRLPLAVLAGAMAGFGAWTKNEGWYYCAALAGIAVWRLRLPGTLRFVAGSLPGIGIAAYYLLTQAPFAGQAVSASPVALLGAMGARFFTWTFLGWAVHPILVLAVYAYCLGRDHKQDLRAACLPVAALLLAGCIATVVRDNNPGDSAGIRLILHVWSCALLALFVMVRAPEEYAAEAASGLRKKR